MPMASRFIEPLWNQAVRENVSKALDATQPMAPEQILTHAVRGQYGQRVMADGEKVPAYHHGHLVRPAPAGLPQLRRRHLGPQGRRGPAQDRRPLLAAHRDPPPDPRDQPPT
jgi:hypothetical protein